MKKFCILCPLLLLAFISCKQDSDKKQTKKEISLHKSSTLIQKNISETKKMEEIEFENFIKKMPLEDKIAQLFIINLEGNSNFRSYETFSQVTGKIDERPLVAGGYLFFSYNLCETPDLQKLFSENIFNYCKKNNEIPPFLAIDQEGGYVNRLRKLTGGLPSQSKVASEYTVEEAYKLYSNQAKKMAEMGFTMNLAPVMEVCTDDNKDFLEGRSFGSREQVIDYGRACVNAYQNNGIAAVIKHFPGNTNTDPHSGLPEITLNKEELEESLIPFYDNLDYAPAGILMSHAITDSVDKGVPSCLSHIWVTEILRNQWNYQGIIFSDDIFMGALQKNGYSPEKAAIMAIEAGIDCIMISEKRFSKPAKVIYEKALEDSEFESKINDSVKRILKYKVESHIVELKDIYK